MIHAAPACGMRVHPNGLLNMSDCLAEQRAHPAREYRQGMDEDDADDQELLSGSQKRKRKKKLRQSLADQVCLVEKPHVHSTSITSHAAA